MRLGEFVEKFVEHNSIVRLWIKTKNGQRAMLLDSDLMAWEVRKIPLLSNLPFIHVFSVVPDVKDRNPDAINLLVDTKLDMVYYRAAVDMYRDSRLAECHTVKEYDVLHNKPLPQHAYSITFNLKSCYI